MILPILKRSVVVTGSRVVVPEWIEVLPEFTRLSA